MKVSFLISLVLGFSLVTKGQAIDSESSTFLSQFFKTRPNTAAFLYSEDVDKYDRDQIKKALSSSATFKTWQQLDIINKPADSIVFTAEEMLAIRTHFEQQQGPLWKDSLLGQGRLVLRDTLDGIFKDKARGWPYFYKTYGKGFYSFTQPLFLRGNTVCLFYYGSYCGYSCAEGQLAIYKKREGTWQECITILYWIS